MVNYIVLAFLLFIYKKHNLYLNINYNLCQTGVSIDDCNYPTIYSSNICYNFLENRHLSMRKLQKDKYN